MKTHVLKGSKQEIAEGLARFSGEVREAIVFVEEAPATAGAPVTGDAEDIFAHGQRREEWRAQTKTCADQTSNEILMRTAEREQAP
ncbi:MAG: hypothetical protein L0Y71_06790 [Gemmataceae bacterium]|nr:hypothetical protein [Gemmataceae bacterium]